MSVSWHEFFAGTIGGFVGKAVEFPMDTVKVLLQTQDRAKPTYTSTWHCIQTIAAQDGARGFYRGISTPMIGSMAEISCLMTSYGFAKRYMGERSGGAELPMWKKSLAGGFAGISTALVLTPVEFVKCRMQVQHTAAYNGPQYRSSVDCILKTIKFDGPQGLFRGLTGTLVREIPGNVAWFGVYELVSDSFKTEDGHLPDIGCITAGAAAGVAYWTFPYPADTVKTRIQISSQQGYGAKTSFFQVLRSIVKEEGVRGLYRGWGVTALRAAPSNAAVFMAYEMCMKAFTGEHPEGHPQHDSNSAQDLTREMPEEQIVEDVLRRGLMPVLLRAATTELLLDELRIRSSEDEELERQIQMHLLSKEREQRLRNHRMEQCAEFGHSNEAGHHEHLSPVTFK